MGLSSVTGLSLNGYSLALSILILSGTVLVDTVLLAHAIRNGAQGETISSLLGLTGALPLMRLVFLYSHSVRLL